MADFSVGEPAWASPWISRTIAFVAVGLGLCACRHNTTDAGHFAMAVAPAERVFDELPSGSRVVEGTRTCIRVDWFVPLDAAPNTRASMEARCFSTTARGMSPDEDGCYTLAEVGEAVFDVRSTGCSETIPASDVYRFEVVADVGLRAKLVSTLDTWGEYGMVFEDGTPYQADAVPAAGQPFRVADGGLFAFSTRMVDERDEPVGYDTEAHPSVLVVRAGSPQLETSEECAPDEMLVRVHAGDELDVVLPFDDGEKNAGTIVGVPREDIASLDIVVLRAPIEDESIFRVARAVVGDGEGNMIFGAPVRWSLRGDPLAVHDEYVELEDYVGLTDACQPPPDRPTEHSATLTASVGGLLAAVEISWVSLPRPGAEGAPFERDPACPSADPEPSDGARPNGCGCSPEGAADMQWLMLWFLVFAPILRRTR